MAMDKQTSQKQTYSPWIRYKVPEERMGQTVETVLKEALMISGRMINRLTRRRGILLNGRPPWLGRPVKAGDELKVAVRPREHPDFPATPVNFSVLYEDRDLMVIDKPAGVNVHPTREGENDTLVNGILYHWREQGEDGIPRPVHRLDRWTSGLILVAKNAYMHQLLDRQLRNKEIVRCYLAFTGKPLSDTTGTIDAPIGRDPHHPLRRRVTPDGEPAVTHYRVLRQYDRASLVEAELETGRTHQIRVHFAHLGAPLLGDSLYGGETSLIRRQALHAARLSFRHPLTGKEMSFHSPFPDDLRKLLETFGLAGEV
jgi:tRNA pseudouridine32 synthase/23S rRNA pseudouridine746 synthase/23S rRNA pseudouridine1911/1915/1917 synthase